MGILKVLGQMGAVLKENQNFIPQESMFQKNIFQFQRLWNELFRTFENNIVKLAEGRHSVRGTDAQGSHPDL